MKFGHICNDNYKEWTITTNNDAKSMLYFMELVYDVLSNYRSLVKIPLLFWNTAKQTFFNNEYCILLMIQHFWALDYPTKFIWLLNLLCWRFKVSCPWFRITSVSLSVSLLQTICIRLQLWIEMVHLDTITISAQNTFVLYLYLKKGKLILLIWKNKPQT